MISGEGNSILVVGTDMTLPVAIGRDRTANALYKT